MDLNESSLQSCHGSRGCSDMKVLNGEVGGDNELVIGESNSASFDLSCAGPFVRPYLEVV